MSKEVHGHDMMDLMGEMGPMPLDALQKLAEERFGQDVTFYTCSSEGMSVAGLMEFLKMRGKVAETSEGIALTGVTCSH